MRNDPAVIRAYLGEEEDDELPPEVAADLARDAAQAEGSGRMMLTVDGVHTFYGAIEALRGSSLEVDGGRDRHPDRRQRRRQVDAC